MTSHSLHCVHPCVSGSLYVRVSSPGPAVYHARRQLQGHVVWSGPAHRASGAERSQVEGEWTVLSRLSLSVCQSSSGSEGKMEK